MTIEMPGKYVRKVTINPKFSGHYGGILNLLKRGVFLDFSDEVILIYWRILKVPLLEKIFSRKGRMTMALTKSWNLP